MKEAIRLRMNKAYENLGATKVILTEGFYGAAVNRAYYAMYCATQALLLTKEVHAKTHKGLHLKFGELFIRTNLLPVKMAEVLAATEDLREEADYDFEAVVSQEEALTGLRNAEYFLDKAEAYLRSQDFLHD